MKQWILKAIIQKAISCLPFRHRINHLFQMYVTKGVRLTEDYLEDRFIHFQKHAGFFSEAGNDPKGRHVLELGTGWYPIVPLCFFLSGASRITTVDLTRFLTTRKLKQAIVSLIQTEEQGGLGKYLRPLPDRWATLSSIAGQPDISLEEMLEALNIHYLVADARALPLEGGAVDLIVSNNTFEHIYPEILEEILLEFQRILRPSGMMSHFIDMSDHFAHLDPSITIYNFLRFSEAQWCFIDNGIQPQNRWRINHYRQLYAKLGIEMIKEENRPGDVAALRTVPVHSDFSGIPENDLAISHSYFVSR